MDNLSLFIIAVSVLLAVLFKWVLFRKSSSLDGAVDQERERSNDSEPD